MAKNRNKASRRKTVPNTAVAANKSDNGIGLSWVLQMGVVAVLAILVYSTVTAGDSGDAAQSAAAPSAQVVVVNTQRLMEAVASRAKAELSKGVGYTGDQLEMKGKIFATELLREVKRYRDAGLIVIDGKGALAVPKKYDITEEVAKKLGLELDEFVDPFSSPALSQ